MLRRLRPAMGRFSLVLVATSCLLGTYGLADEEVRLPENWMFSGEEISAMLGELMRIHTPDGIEELKELDIGGSKQWISIRGLDRANPVLLMIHGGPGVPMMPYSWSFQKPWEDFFTVVQWDQRGVGKSIIDEVAVAGHLSQEQLLADAIEMAEHLTGRFSQERIFVMGESFGSLVALQLAAERPDLLHAYVGIGQMVAWQASLNETRRLAMAGARERGDDKGVLGPG